MNNIGTKDIPLIAIAASAILMVVLFFPFSLDSSESSPIKFQSTVEPVNYLEIDDSTVSTPGSDGEEVTSYNTTGTLFQRIFLPSQVTKEFKDKEITKQPVNQITRKGTIKYQYMYCSNQTYRYYTNEQFASPDVGFTSKSPDTCTSSGNGVKKKLSNTPPTAAPTCIDVTSYDYNWNNDVLCTNPDGSRYYTSYEGAGW